MYLGEPCLIDLFGGDDQRHTFFPLFSSSSSSAPYRHGHNLPRHLRCSSFALFTRAAGLSSLIPPLVSFFRPSYFLDLIPLPALFHRR
ncbi:hypothetical protein CGRA01v4_01446 [Colletotrichum graminicola]|nr:hypothetical protein CGRA01v4_01446 [Colletotrichum graminicola]